MKSKIYNVFIYGTSLFLCVFIYLIFLVNSRLYQKEPSIIGVEEFNKSEIREQCNFLKRSLEEGQDIRMQEYFPEGYFFTNVLYGLSWINIGLQQSVNNELKTEALVEARWVLERLRSKDGLAAFDFEMGTGLDHGVFYRAWMNYLLAGILLLQERDHLNKQEVESFTSECALIMDAIKSSPIPFLEAYPQQCWPVDTFPAILSIKIYGQLFDAKYELELNDWLERIENFNDVAQGLLPHKIDSKSGVLIEGTRATSQSLIQLFLYEISLGENQKQYLDFRDRFTRDLMGLRGLAEYPDGVNGSGDVDSGPLVFGMSASATTVFLGTSRLYGDHNLASLIRQFGEGVGFPRRSNKEKFYLNGSLPVGDAFFVWAKTMTPWCTEAYTLEEHNIYPTNNWRWGIHLISTLLTMLNLWLLIRLYKLHRGKKPIHTVFENA